MDRKKRIATDKTQQAAMFEQIQALHDKEGIGFLLDLAAPTKAEQPVEPILDAWIDRAAKRWIPDNIVEAPQ
ncbi:MAG TPA: hypothetical protein VFX76_08310, partial [Roseiflexaceae bacterium]|nr:hypothetical protein [Roseiflexaceae bacterium]